VFSAIIVALFKLSSLAGKSSIKPESLEIWRDNDILLIFTEN
jgi:hypothetical protein